MRQLVAKFVSSRDRRRASAVERWDYFGSFGDDCFDDEPLEDVRTPCGRRRAPGDEPRWPSRRAAA